MGQYLPLHPPPFLFCSSGPFYTNVKRPGTGCEFHYGLLHHFSTTQYHIKLPSLLLNRYPHSFLRITLVVINTGLVKRVDVTPLLHVHTDTQYTDTYDCTPMWCLYENLERH